MENKLPWYHIEECFICDKSGLIFVRKDKHSDQSIGVAEQCPGCNGYGEVRVRKHE